MQQINVRSVGQVKTVRDIEDTVITTKNGTALHVKDIAVVAQGPKVRLGQFGRAIHRADGKIMDNDDVVSGIVLLRKGADSDETLEAIHAKTEELNDHLLPPGVKVVPFLDRSELLHLTTHTVMHNLTEGIILVSVILFLFLGNVRGAIIVTLTIPFSLLFAAICLSLRHIPANLLSLGALDFGMIVEGAVVMVENIVRLLSHPGADPAETVPQKISRAAFEVQRPVFYSILIIIVAYVPIFTLQAVEGRLFKPMAWTVTFALLGALLYSLFVGPVLASLVYPKGTKEWHNPLMGLLNRGYGWALGDFDSLAVGHAGGGGSHSGRHIHAGSNHRLRISSASGRRRDLGARDPGAEHRTHRRYPSCESGSGDPGRLSGSHHDHQPGGTAGRWRGYDGLLQYGIFRRAEAEGRMAAGVPSEQRRADRRHESRTGKDSRV